MGALRYTADSRTAFASGRIKGNIHKKLRYAVTQAKASSEGSRDKPLT